MTQEEQKAAHKSRLKRWIQSPWPLVWGLILITIFFTLGEIIKLILPYTKYHHVPGFVAEIAANKLRPKISYPISEFVDIKGVGRLFVILYYLVIGYLLVLVHTYAKKYYKYLLGLGIVIFLFLRVFPGTLLLLDSSDPSISVGTPGKGSIENSRRLPFQSDYKTYSFMGYLMGRTYVHHQLKDVIIETYDLLNEKFPKWQFFIGDCGLKEGGPIAFHKEKQNGLQVDFLVPMNKDGKPYNESSLFNKWNYGLTLGEDGTFDGATVDLSVLGSHISTLHSVCTKHGLAIKKIEMHPDMRKALLGKKLASLLKNILGRAIKKENLKYPAYYTVTFEIKRKRKPLDFLKRNKDD